MIGAGTSLPAPAAKSPSMAGSIGRDGAVSAADMTDLQRTTTPPPKPQPSAHEVALAELEVKLRNFLTDLLKPSINRVTCLETVLGEMQSRLQADEEKLQELERMSKKVDEQVRNVDGFRLEMSCWDSERHAFQAEAQENMSVMRIDLESFRYQLERGDSQLHGVQRTLDRIVAEVNRLQEGTEALRKHVEQRLTQTTKQLSAANADLDVKLISVEMRFNRLNDELWGEETGLSKVVSDLRATDRILDALGEDIKGMQHEKASMVQLHAIQVEVNALMCESNSTISVLRKSVDSALGNLKEHFKTATNTVSAHNASMLQEVRKSYQDELAESANIRAEVMGFMKTAREDVLRLDRSLLDQLTRSEELAKRVREEVEDVSKMRRRDRNTSEVEVLSLKTNLETALNTQKEVARSVEHLVNVIWMVVQSEGAASALELQDDTDRGKVALMGYRDNKAQSASRTLRGRRASPNPQGPEETGSSAPVISVDHQCVSCSGQAQQVLSGFKMACLEYAPGPVSFARKVWNRSELLDWRSKLLGQAQEALSSGSGELRREWPTEVSAPSPGIAPTGCGGGLPISTPRPGSRGDSLLAGEAEKPGKASSSRGARGLRGDSLSASEADTPLSQGSSVVSARPPTKVKMPALKLRSTK